MAQNNKEPGGTSAKRWGYALVAITAIIVKLLNDPHGDLPALGKLLDPINGCLANAEATSRNFDATIKIPGVGADARVWLDDRQVPHIYASNDHDLFLLQGYVHAYFRLWQMDMQTRAAAGRISEVAGEKSFDFDRKQRRKGMVYAAELSLKAAEADQKTKAMLDAYTEGVNAFVKSLKYKNYPLEYKLMSFAPEAWSNLRSVLLLKYMADDLTGKTDDIAHSYLRTILTLNDFDYIYNDRIAGSSTVIPEGTAWEQPSLHQPLPPADSVAFPTYTGKDFGEQRATGIGSNNWVLSGSRTASGAPILCNDPHLALNLPSVWFEMQLSAPGTNVYGVSMPGAAGIVIGFNDSLSWGFTNNYRDVKDFYQIKPVADDPERYWFAGKKTRFATRIEHIKIKGKSDFVDTVKYSIHGPLIYDATFNENGRIPQPLAMCWTGLRGSNEYLAFYKLNRARNYKEFVSAIQHYECPAQNMIYADRAGNIALWGQGQYINKWKNQGKYIMNGWDSATLWQELIPMSENPHALNPEQGFLSSANQCVTDTTYPYWYNGDFIELRSWRINALLDKAQQATVQDMFAMQQDNYSVLAAGTLPLMLSYCNDIKSDYLDTLRKWDYHLNSNGTAATIYQLWWRNLYSDIWKDDFSKVPGYVLPLAERTMQLMQTDTACKYFDNKRTAKVETLREMVQKSYNETVDSLLNQEKTIGLLWYKAKNTSVTHLTKIPAFSYSELATGGWGNTINAMKGNHGPSWRMVVQMGKEIEAYGVYPGGQSGNPGSKYYANYLQHWADGNYYKLLFLPAGKTQQNDRILYEWSFSNK
ncbi:MAG: penicillin acylase family protein [Taibaiella sp.]|nr:penicillin acylase family protein [Taibaiella sp.]